VLKGEQIKIIDEEGTSLPDCPSLLKALLAFTSGVNGSHSTVNVLVQLAASMRAHGHGGTLLVTTTGSDKWRSSIAHPIQYSVGPHFTALSDIMRGDLSEETQSQWGNPLRRAVDTVAGLTAVDGATVINDQYQVLAFGAKIRRSERATPVER